MNEHLLGEVHPTAIIHPTASIHASVTVAPYAVIGAGSIIGAGTCIANHATIGPNTTLGENNIIEPYAYVGADPHVYEYGGEDVYLKIGNRNTFKSNVNISRGSLKGSGITTIGDDNHFLYSSHVGHDVVIGSDVTLGGYSGASGHVIIYDGVTISGHVGLHQFLRVGTLAMIAAPRITKDIAPYTIATPEKGYSTVLNSVGLKRNGVSRESIRVLKEVLRIYIDKNFTLVQVRERVAMLEQTQEVTTFLEFISEDSQRSYGR